MAFSWLKTSAYVISVNSSVPEALMMTSHSKVLQSIKHKGGAKLGTCASMQQWSIKRPTAELKINTQNKAEE